MSRRLRYRRSAQCREMRTFMSFGGRSAEMTHIRNRRERIN